MATASASAPSWKAAVRDLSIRAMGWFIPMLISALAAAWLTYYYTQKANTALVVQQQKLSDLQQFRSSGAQFEQALSRMSDAIVDNGAGLESARRDMRDAISRHMTDADAVRGELGPGAGPYIEKLAELRTVVDNTDADSGQALWGGSLDIMQERRRLLATAERRAVVK